jgi:hypothetical protein
MANLPTVLTAAVFSVVFGWLLRPTCFTRRCFDHHRLTLRVDACATKALDSAAVVDVWNRFSIVHCFPSRLFVFRFLLSIVSQTLVNSWYSRSHWPMRQFIRYAMRPSSTQLCIHVRELLLNFSDIARLPISGSRWSVNNSFVITLSRWILLCPYTLTTSSQMSLASLYVNSKSATGWLSALAINAAVWALSRFHANKFFYRIPRPFQCSLYWDISAIRQQSTSYNTVQSAGSFATSTWPNWFQQPAFRLLF